MVKRADYFIFTTHKYAEMSPKLNMAHIVMNCEYNEIIILGLEDIGHQSNEICRL